MSHLRLVSDNKRPVRKQSPSYAKQHYKPGHEFDWSGLIIVAGSIAVVILLYLIAGYWDWQAGVWK